MGAKYVFNPLTGNLDTTDVVAFNGEVNLGTAAAPSVFFTGDSNTGIYSPGADQVAISTNGTGRLFIDANGTTRIENNAVNNSPLFRISTFNGFAEINSKRSTGGSYSQLRGTYAGNVTDFWQIGSNGFTDGSFAIWAGSNAQERLRITSDGKLGLGTSTPLAPVHFASSVTGSDGDSKGVILSLVNTATAVAGTGSSVSFGCNLATSGTSVAVNIASIEGIKENGINGNFAGALKFVTRAHAGSPTERMRINSSGNVGIGTSGPLYPLHIEKNQEDLLALINTGVVTYRFQAKSDASFAIVQNATERARIDSSGRLLVGTSTARGNFNNSSITPQLQVEGIFNSTSSAALIANGSASAPNPQARLFLGRSKGALGTNVVVSADDALGSVSYQGNDGSEFVEAASISAFVDNTPGANDMPGRLVFSSTPSGSASPDEVMRITSDKYVRLASGTGGIQFNGDTAAANALDDYEEGTFTPFLYSDTGGEWPGKITESGSYTKIGRLVHCQGFVEWSSKAGGASGTVRFRGLPFGSTSSTEPAPYIRFGSTELFDAIRIQSTVVSSHFRVGGAVASSGDFQSSGKIYFNFVYRIS